MYQRHGDPSMMQTDLQSRDLNFQFSFLSACGMCIVISTPAMQPSWNAIMKTNKKWLLSFWEGCLKWCVFHIPVGCSGNELAELEVVCLRDRSRKGEREITHSLVLSVKLTSVAELAGRFSGPSQLARKSCCPWCSMWPSCWAVQWNWFARVNALCNLLRKKSPEVALSLPGQFLSRRCFMLCITMEVEPRIAKQYKCHRCYSCKNYHGERGWKVEKSVFALFFWLTRTLRFHGKNAFWGIL